MGGFFVPDKFVDEIGKPCIFVVVAALTFFRVVVVGRFSRILGFRSGAGC